MSDTTKSVSLWKNGKPVAYVYVVPERLVRNYLRRVSKNPNSQGRRLLRELGILKDSQ